MKTKILGLAIISTLVACGQKKTNSSDLENMQVSLEAGVTAVNAAADDQAGSSYAKTSPFERKNAIVSIGDWLLPKSYAASCSRAALEPCMSGVKSESFSSCDLPASGRSLDGSVTLTYSNSSCNLAVGDSVTRTYDFTISGPYGGRLHISSANATDFSGNTYGGGGILTHTGSNAWSIQVLGKHAELSVGGRTLMDLQMRTLSDLSITGSLTRSGRVVDGGSFEVAHNLAKFTATYSPHNLTWTAFCCHPVSGTLSVSYAGSLSGSATVIFNGCGSATIEKDGLSRDVSLNYCE